MLNNLRSKAASSAAVAAARNSRRVVGLLAAALMCVSVTAAGASVDAGATGSAAAKPTLTLGYATAVCNNSSPISGLVYEVRLAYEPLIFRDVNGNLQPALATAWKVSSYKGRPNKMLTLTLRKGVRFSDGSPFDAAAVKTYMDYRATKATQYSAYIVKPQVQVLSKYVVRIIAQTPNPDLPEAMRVDWGRVASPSAVQKSIANPEQDFLARNSAGAGPYMLDPDQTVPGDHCTLVPNPYYYDKKNIKWGKIVIKYVGDSNAALAALRTGQLDVMINGGSNIAAAAKAAGLRDVVSPGPVIGMLELDRSGALSKPLADVRVRQALNYALNRTKIARALGGPGAAPTSNEDQSRVMPNKWQQYYAYNPAKARQLLRQAGYANGFEFTVFARGPFYGAANNTPDALAMAQDFAAVGVKMVVEPMNNTPDFLAAINSKKYPGWVVTIGLDSTANFYNALLAPKVFLGDQHGWSDPVLNKLYYKAIAAPSKRAAETLWEQIDARAIEQAYFIPVYLQPQHHFVNKRVGGVVAGKADAYNPSDPLRWFPSGN